MTSASTKSARSLFIESKNRLADRVQVNLNNIGSIMRQIQRGAKSHEMLGQTTTQLAQQERSVENTEEMVKQLQLIMMEIETQAGAVEKSLAHINQLENRLSELEFLCSPIN